MVVSEIIAKFTLALISEHMKKGQIFSKSYAGQLLRMRKIEEVGTLVDHIANEGYKYLELADIS